MPRRKSNKKRRGQEIILDLSSLDLAEEEKHKRRRKRQRKIEKELSEDTLFFASLKNLKIPEIIYDLHRIVFGEEE